MALFTPSESPAVVVKEVDLTGGVPNVQTSTGAIVGNFRWGPVEEVTLVANEAGLIETFATPDTDNAIDFHNASYFLRYSNSLQVVRAVSSAAKNAQASTHQSASETPSAPLVKNKTAFDGQLASLDSDGITFIARFPGDLGNALEVSMCAYDSAGGSTFDNWAYKSSFDDAPNVSAYDSDRDGSRTEVHVAIVDKTGELSGTKGKVLETYPFVSVASNSKNTDGTSNFVKDIINEKSNYVYLVNFDSDQQASNYGTAMTPGTGKSYELTGISGDRIKTFAMHEGVASASLSAGEFNTGIDLFADKDTVEVDFIIAPGMASDTDQATVTNNAIAKAVARKDCVAVTSPHRNALIGVTNASTATNNIIAVGNLFTKTSYAVMDANYLKVYDKFNDQYIEIPAASSTAGIMAETDRTAAPWFSPAGTRRGQYLGVTNINYNPSKSNRDSLYKKNINPVVNMAGSGVMLFGDKTLLDRPSAFDRINVRRLFLTLERAIARAAEGVMFEFNDEFTRAEFVNIIEPVLRDIKGRRGITDFRVIADETVNTPAVIDRNEFIANIYIKPARSINYVTLNFVAVRTGVEFTEVTGA